MTEHPFFIVGFPRSGTTMLRLLLNRHPRISIPPESHFIPELQGKLKGPFSVEDFASLLFQHQRYRDWGLDDQQLLRRLRQAPSALGDLIGSCYSEYAALHGKSRWGDKTPGYVDQMPRILEVFPDARFIHIVRDGRDVWCSLTKLDWWKRDLSESAKSWSRRVSLGRSTGQSLRDHHYLEVRYEDLVRKPEENLRRICEHIDESFTDHMLGFHEDAMDHVVSRFHKYHRRLAGPIDDGSVGTWRREMAATEIREFELAAGETLRALHYL